MSTFLTAIGAALLIWCFIWGYSWLEVWRDPKSELKNFYARHPRTERWVAVATRLWLPTLVTGIIFIVLGFFAGGAS